MSHGSISPDEDVGLSAQDPHGQAALLIAESLLHVLIDRSIITAEDAVDVVDTALDVAGQVARESAVARPVALRTCGLLQNISVSLHYDIRDGGQPTRDRDRA